MAGSHGDLFYLRIYSGILKANSRPYNATRDLKEFASKLYHTHADPTDRTEVRRRATPATSSPSSA